MSVEKKQRGKGRLMIFLGMAAGVGKTYTMLEAAHKKRKEGVDVIVGIVYTHGRPETAQLVESLSIISEKTIVYKEKIFKELDLDEIIRRKPQLVLIDELAHSNVPGSQHLKRWQDVVEILDHGIDVYTTLNIQHIESYKDIVEGITQIKIRETVPDLMLEQASEIELVDITPSELLQRLREGKVYTGEFSKIALEHFFQEDRLTALREIALRFTAQKVDQELQEKFILTKKGKSWRHREKLLVSVNHEIYAQHLIRAARRLSFTLHAPWVVVYIDTGKVLDESASIALAKNFSLARELGAEVITIQDTDIAVAIHRVAEQEDVTQIIIGKSDRKKIRTWFRRSLADRLSNMGGNIDILILKYPDFIAQTKWHFRPNILFKTLFPYLHIAFWVALFSIFNIFLAPYFGYKVVGGVFLLTIFLFSLFFEFGPLVFSALLYFLIWDFFFIPQKGVLDITSSK